MKIVVDGRATDIGRLRIIIAGASSSTSILEEAAAKRGGRLEFPIERSYVSLPETVEVYYRLVSICDSARVRDALLLLRDAMLIDVLGIDVPDLDRLRQSKGYQDSLLRGTSEQRAFKMGRRAFGLAGEGESDAFQLGIRLAGAGDPLTIDFSLRDDVYKNRISVLIGKNGTGKTQALERLVALLTRRGRPTVKGARAKDVLDPRPSVGQVTAISFSPYDHFPADDFDESAKDASYLHFGFRVNGRTLSARTANRRAALALVKIVNEYHDATYDLDRDRFEIVATTLRACVDFDTLVVRHRNGKGAYRERTVIDADSAGKPFYGDTESASLVFRKNGRKVWLSAGQNQYALLIVSLCAYLSHRSLVLIDEPEIGLHPNLEVDLLRALKVLLARFASFAIIATHSAVVLREVPASHIHILNRDENSVWASPPTMETFGADISTIINEVFGDLEVDPAYETQLRDLAAGIDTFPLFAKIYGHDLSPEALSFVRNQVFGKPLAITRK